MQTKQLGAQGTLGQQWGEYKGPNPESEEQREREESEAGEEARDLIRMSGQVTWLFGQTFKNGCTDICITRAILNPSH